jgi:hypothetical protein
MATTVIMVALLPIELPSALGMAAGTWTSCSSHGNKTGVLLSVGAKSPIGTRIDDTGKMTINPVNQIFEREFRVIGLIKKLQL